jgi:hypothetical protein
MRIQLNSHPLAIIITTTIGTSTMQFLHNRGDQSSSPFNFSFKVSKIHHLPIIVALLKIVIAK